MFRKTKFDDTPSSSTVRKRDVIPSIITRDLNILGNIVSEGTVDIDGNIEGNVRAATVTVRLHGVINGEIVADNVLVYGRIKGLIRAKSVHLYASCHIEGVIMHESLSIEDGAFIDGKCKRTDKVQPDEDEDEDMETASERPSADLKVLENFRLIR